MEKLRCWKVNLTGTEHNMLQWIHKGWFATVYEDEDKMWRYKVGFERDKQNPNNHFVSSKAWKTSTIAKVHALENIIKLKQYVNP